MDLDELYTVIQTPCGLRTFLLVNEIRKAAELASLIRPGSNEAGERLISAMLERQQRPTERLIAPEAA